MILLDCPVKQFTFRVSPGADATCPLGRSEQLSHMQTVVQKGLWSNSLLIQVESSFKIYRAGLAKNLA